MMEVKTVQSENFKDWLELAKEVEPFFGPMVDEASFQSALRIFIEQKQAFCIQRNGEFCGVIAISKEENEILWFAVLQKHKGKGYGKLLLQHAIDELVSSKDIKVQTFASRIKVGEPARKLYEKFGFVDFKQCENNPAGYPTVLMVKPPNKF